MSSEMITVAEAARRMRRSPDQVRRDLRRGKLKGHRIGRQWAVDSQDVGEPGQRYLVPRELMEEIRELREEIYRQNGIVFDIVAMIHESRDDD